MERLHYLIQKIRCTREDRLSQQKLLDQMKQEEDSMSAELQEAMIALGISCFKDETIGFEAVLKPKIDPEVVNWETFYEHIRTTGEVDLLQKRPMVSAIKARWEQGDDVPGVERVETEALSIVKSKG